mmetsp:Transcript_4674/g.8515  ORF Transcript_4674/g.8515 Transcript_4674/m.8515 type:complete len:203 (+) Transcript_4674:1131-1739(+)
MLSGFVGEPTLRRIGAQHVKQRDKDYDTWGCFHRPKDQIVPHLRHAPADQRPQEGEAPSTADEQPGPDCIFANLLGQGIRLSHIACELRHAQEIVNDDYTLNGQPTSILWLLLQLSILATSLCHSTFRHLPVPLRCDRQIPIQPAIEQANRTIAAVSALGYQIDLKLVKCAQKAHTRAQAQTAYVQDESVATARWRCCSERA